MPPTSSSVSTRTAVTKAFVVTESTEWADSVRVNSQTNRAYPCDIKSAGVSTIKPYTPSSRTFDPS